MALTYDIEKIMLVVVPTYKRLDCLRLSLWSVLENNLPSAEPVRLLIANNYPDHRLEVEELVATLVGHPRFGFWQIIFHHWPQTVHAHINWYDTIAAYANEDEVVVLHGDDDLLTPWSLVQRHKVMMGECDFLLSGVGGTITFLSSTKIHFRGNWSQPALILDNEVLTSENFERFGNVFIGSHTYKLNTAFRASVARARSWTEHQSWVGAELRNLMFPYYLVLAYFYEGAQVRGVHWHGCLRGTSLEERISARYNASFGWSSGLLLWLMLELLEYDPLKKMALSATRQYVRHQACQWCLTTFFDDRVPAELRRELSRRVPLHPTWKEYLFSIKAMAIQFLGLKAASIRWDVALNRNTFDASDFIKQLAVHGARQQISN